VLIFVVLVNICQLESTQIQSERGLESQMKGGGETKFSGNIMNSICIQLEV